MSGKVRLTGDARRVLRRVLETENPSAELQAEIEALPLAQQRELAHRVVRDARQKIANHDAQLREHRAIRAETVASLRLLDTLTRANGVSEARRSELAAQAEKLSATIGDLDDTMVSVDARRRKLLEGITELDARRRATG